MKLTKKKIQRIDNFLVGQKIKYLDMRSELIDHLASEFEEKSNYSLIEDYLITKVNFIKDFAKKRQKAIHWSYQKQLWVQFAKFFYKPKLILCLLILIASGYTLLQFLTFKVFGNICFFTLVILTLYPLYYQIKYSKAVKKVQSLQSLFTIASLPTLFLYAYSMLRDRLLDNHYVLIIYFSYSILLGVSAVIIIERDRKKVLEKYNQLVG